MKNTEYLYFRDVNKYPLLTKEEVLELHEKAKNGDTEARDKLINSNLRLVLKIARTFTASGLDIMDLIQQGNVGLIEAVDNYDPDKGALSTFATLRITQSISRYCYSNQNLMRKPEWQQELSNKINNVISDYIVISGRKPTVDEIATILDITPERIEKICQDNSISIVALDATIYDEDSSKKLEEIIPDESPSQFDTDKQRKAIAKALKHLSEDDAKFLIDYFGLNGKGKNMTQMAEEAGLTKQAIQHRKQAILQKLRYPDILEEIRKEL